MKCPDGCPCGKHRRSKPLADSDGATYDAPAEPTYKLVYHDNSHRYYLETPELGNKRATGVSSVAKIAADDRNIRLWHERMVALGVTMDPNLRENVAAAADDKDTLEDLCEAAKKVAKANLPADRGSQKHRVLELILTGQKDRLITDQQRADAAILERTLDRYRLTPRTELAEQFVIFPEWTVAGRFDAVLAFETADGRIVLVDLKSGENAIKYPHTTAAQLAMYTNAPHISMGRNTGYKVEIEQWHTMPDGLDHDIAYVLLVNNVDQVGTLHGIDIRHGWKAAQWAMELIAWRKQFDYGRGMVHPVVDRFAAWVPGAATDDELRTIWRDANRAFCLTDDLKQAILARRQELTDGQTSSVGA